MVQARLRDGRGACVVVNRYFLNVYACCPYVIIKHEPEHVFLGVGC